MEHKARQILLEGVVQGVGFRPFVYRLAKAMGLKGWVNNSSLGVTIHVEGEGLELFHERLLKEAPPLAKILSVQQHPEDFRDYATFEILESANEDSAKVLIAPDIATCQDCLNDISASGSRRYRYPFTNCTNCGPRYTIIRDVPYDRRNTTMEGFAMCEACAEEYHDPENRRFHAQPIACALCGPQVELRDARASLYFGNGTEQLAQGAILAVKGLGGFHLVCDASNREAVRRLRAKKERGDKPFALMAHSPQRARQEVYLSPLEEEWLQSPAAPILILERRRDSVSSLPAELAPGIDTLGLMLPYTPLHHLLFDAPYDFLVMTSANLSGSPLIYDNEEALEKLRGIADFFLIHDRPIHHPCDDSVLQIIGGEAVFLRRSRGFVPLPIRMPSGWVKTPLLGVGGDLKNSFCLASERQAFVSQYLGDMDNYENLMRFDQELEAFQRVVNITPQALAYDQHPNYALTRYALEQDLPKQAIQHHHAHLVSVLGEWGRTEATLGMICDGTGMGSDGQIWGFELLEGNRSEVERRGQLEYLPLPGGDAGAKHPQRLAYAYLKTLLNPEECERANSLWTVLTATERKILDRQLETGFQVFMTSSAGRLFDAVSGLLGICSEVTYEGQAAIELERVAARFASDTPSIRGNSLHDGADRLIAYPYEIIPENSLLVLKVARLFRAMLEDIEHGISRGEIAWRFHQTIACAIVDMAEQAGVGSGPLVLNGGVFLNKLLTETVLELCRNKGIEILRSRELPPGDGGIAFGQVLIANQLFE